DLVDAQTMAATAALMAAISTMDAAALGVLATATSSGPSGPVARDSLVAGGSLFALSDILTMEPRRVRQAAQFFGSIARLRAPELQEYLRDIGWQARGVAKTAADGSAVQPIPNLGLVFPLADPTLAEMAVAARSYAGAPTRETRNVRPEVVRYLADARAFFDVLLPPASPLALLAPGASPVITALTELVALSYMYPSESYWSLVWRYYQQLGMPGLSWVSTYPSHVIGDLASSLVGGYVSGVISSAVASVIGGDGPAPRSTPFATSAVPSATAAASNKTAGSQTPAAPTQSLVAPAAPTVTPAAPTQSLVATSPPFTLRGTVVLPPATPRKTLGATQDPNYSLSTGMSLQLTSQPEALVLTATPDTQ
ncbi:hypothetical protein H4R21_003131, partial [Coemansia helicoidea]